MFLHLSWHLKAQRRNLGGGGFYLPLLICGGECLEWSDGSDLLSGERERLLRCLSCDRLEWSDAKEWMSEMSDQTRATVQHSQSAKQQTSLVWGHASFYLIPTPLLPSRSEALAEGMLSSRSGMFSRVALSSLWTTIFSLPFDLSISFLASIKERFSVTVPLIWVPGKKRSYIRWRILHSHRIQAKSKRNETHLLHVKDGLLMTIIVFVEKIRLYTWEMPSQKQNRS